MQEPERNLTKLVVPREEAKERIEGQGSQLLDILTVKPKTNAEFQGHHFRLTLWEQYTYEMLRRLFSTDQPADEFASETEGITEVIIESGYLSYGTDQLARYARSGGLQLASILNKMDLYPESQPDLAMDVGTNAINIVERLATRFHHFASQLATRQRGREPLKISDEYDLQDVFHDLLRLSFDDVRPEEWTPSYAGGSSRIDFVLKPQQIVVELKMTNAKLGNKEVANQLIIDIERYQSHTDCRAIVCLVYDPSHFIKNPIGLENDLSRPRDNIRVNVIVSPR